MKEYFNDLIFAEFEGDYLVKESADVEAVTIPETFNGKKVIMIGDWAFAGNMKLKNVTIPKTIKTIYGNAFAGCGNLESIVIPKTVERIDGLVFAVCEKLTIYCEAEHMHDGISAYWNTWNCPVFWYSENKPEIDGNFWHYENGSPKKW
jgi:hypothetical protein